jgi:hypothetical protein
VTRRTPLRLTLPLALAMLAACTGSGSSNGVPGSAATGPSASPSEPLAPPSPVPLPPLTLVAALSEPPPAWRQVAFLPFGGDPADLGAMWPSARTTTPVVPPSFTLAADGSFWLADLVNERLAHYSPSGVYLGEVRGLPFGLHRPRARDLAFWGDRLVVLQELERAALLTPVRPDLDGLEPSSPVTAGGLGLYLLHLYSSAGEPLAWIDGFSELDLLGTGPRGVADVDPPVVHVLPGAPLRQGAWMDVRVSGPRQMVVTFSTTEIASTQRIRIRVTGGRGGAARRLPAQITGMIEGIEGGAVLLYVGLAPSSAAAATRYGSGRWLLRLGSDGSPLVWQRLPTPAIDDTLQERHLATGPDGRIYLMVPDRRGEHIYSR